jgi:predicted flap endonuclease-1-like 5' DNA nuclease
MNMRLDYPLYGLAIVLFAVAALLYMYVLPNEILYPIVTAVVGFLLIGSGFFLKPKVASEQIAPSSVPTPKPAPQQAVPVEKAPEAEQSSAALQAEPAPVVEAPKPEPAVPPATPVLAPVAAPPAIAAPPVEPALPAPSTAPAPRAEAPKSGLSQIRGISATRAEQLKAAGVSTIQELANASPEDLAAKLGVSPKIVKMWVGSAKKLK